MINLTMQFGAHKGVFLLIMPLELRWDIRQLIVRHLAFGSDSEFREPAETGPLRGV